MWTPLLNRLDNLDQDPSWSQSSRNMNKVYQNINNKIETIDLLRLNVLDIIKTDIQNRDLDILS